MGAHVGFDKSGATFGEDVANGRLQASFVSYVLNERLIGRGLIIDATHDD